MKRQSTSIHKVLILKVLLQRSFYVDSFCNYSYSNRSLCYIQLKNYAKAESDASNSIRCDPLFVKAWLRRGICRISRNQCQKAYIDLMRVIVNHVSIIIRQMN